MGCLVSRVVHPEGDLPWGWFHEGCVLFRWSEGGLTRVVFYAAGLRVVLWGWSFVQVISLGDDLLRVVFYAGGLRAVLQRLSFMQVVWGRSYKGGLLCRWSEGSLTRVVFYAGGLRVSLQGWSFMQVVWGQANKGGLLCRWSEGGLTRVVFYAGGLRAGKQGWSFVQFVWGWAYKGGLLCRWYNMKGSLVRLRVIFHGGHLSEGVGNLS